MHEVMDLLSKPGQEDTDDMATKLIVWLPWVELHGVHHIMAIGCDQKPEAVA